ncbi:tRNA methyltransferase 10 homolog B isoform X4 [Petaurus breviceps papuanus]|uniref:tRNA methyltransferase 10 homolog B isoform X4 n=1 Tax=Petaurus breviceps papuanus TaxID=3040969 RepID=UPI0036DB0240
MIKDVEHKPEGSSPQAESPSLTRQEPGLEVQEDGDGETILESFQLLQIDTEFESGRALPMDGEMWCSELSRLAGQIRRLYGSNKKAKKPFWICLTGFTTDSPLYEECLRMNDGFSNYLIDTTEEDCLNLFPLESLVYLTPDSEHALEDVDLAKVYVIGGLVDESIQKKLTFQKAQENSIQTARLPIQEYMVKNANAKNYHSEILAINQVFDILSTYVETRNWPAALKTGVSLGKDQGQRFSSAGGKIASLEINPTMVLLQVIKMRELKNQGYNHMPPKDHQSLSKRESCRAKNQQCRKKAS